MSESIIEVTDVTRTFMIIWKTSFLDDRSLWPESALVKLPEPFADDRGFIQELVNIPMKSAYIIHSTKGAVRANHWHKTDWHFCYVISGYIHYYSRPHGSIEEPQMIIVNKDELLFTPPMVEHAMHFPEDTLFIVLSRNPRDEDSYETDVERKLIVNPSDL